MTNEMTGTIDLSRLAEIKEKERINKLVHDLDTRMGWVERKMLTVTDLMNFKTEIHQALKDEMRPVLAAIAQEELAKMLHEMKEALAEELCGVIDERLDEL